jgi:hypothetical protein
VEGKMISYFLTIANKDKPSEYVPVFFETDGPINGPSSINEEVSFVVPNNLNPKNKEYLKIERMVREGETGKLMVHLTHKAYGQDLNDTVEKFVSAGWKRIFGNPEIIDH